MAGAARDTDDPRAYRQLAALIREQIRSGALAPGQSAPSITALSRDHGRARQTCAKPLRLLEAEGLVRRVTSACPCPLTTRGP